MKWLKWFKKKESAVKIYAINPRDAESVIIILQASDMSRQEREKEWSRLLEDIRKFKEI